MEFREFLKILGRKKKVFILFVLVFLAVAMAFVLVTPLQYQASSRVLISQEFAEGESSYAITQANNNVSKMLARIVSSSSFLKDVVNSPGYNVETRYFSPTGDTQEMAREWKNTVEAEALSEGGGIIKIRIYHPDREELRQIAEAVNHVLQTKHSQYHQMGDRVKVRVIDYPVLSEFPVRPNVFYIFSLALVLGVITGGSYIYLFYAPSSVPQESRGQERVDPDQLKAHRDHQVSKEGPYSCQQEPSTPHIPIKQEDEEEFLRPEEPGGSPQKEPTLEQSETIKNKESQEKEKEKESFSQESPPEKDKGPRDIEEKGDMRNILE